MTYIFYDTETSSRDFLGQILSYAFIVTDSSYRTVREFTGMIALNLTQLPDPEAILVNRIDLNALAANGQPEYAAAEAIFNFLNSVLGPQGTATLVGFNSNRFDLQFLRNLLIRYGFNPYFGGRLKNLDVLHFAQFVAMKHSEIFPWQLDESDPATPYYTFKLERLAMAFELLDAPQSHEARSDVVLTIDLVRVLEEVFGESLGYFTPFDLGISEFNQDPNLILEQTVIARGEQIDDLVSTLVWLPVVADRKQKNCVLLDLIRWENRTPELSILSCLKYINANKNFFVTTPLSGSNQETWVQIATEARQALADLQIKTLDDYFRLTPKTWDIEYQIHEMGFERIDQLRYIVKRLLADPGHYAEDLNTLLGQWRQSGKDPKDTYLIQLYNRVYLNWHPNPRPEDLQKYIGPRYVTGTMLRDQEGFAGLEQRIVDLRAKLETVSAEDRALLLPVLCQFESLKIPLL